MAADSLVNLGSIITIKLFVGIYSSFQVCKRKPIYKMIIMPYVVAKNSNLVIRTKLEE
jgi:hypothetical protein